MATLTDVHALTGVVVPKHTLLGASARTVRWTIRLVFAGHVPGCDWWGLGHKGAAKISTRDGLIYNN
jgi:hypothetical protein